MFKNFQILIFVCIAQFAEAQNTVGLLEYSSEENYSEGNNLIYPHYQANAYLLNACGEIVHQWIGPEEYRNHNTCYIQENGDLIRTLRRDVGFAPIWSDIGETLIECRNWNDSLKWSFSFLNETSRLHHDIEPTPQGTVLLISWDHYSVEEAKAFGRDSSLMLQEAFSPDKIIEYDPSVDSIIWEWKAWDHLVQDRNSELPNYGVIKDHPRRIDINYENNQGRADWMHVNSIDYNPILDQIMINVPTFNEIWIIDHSTTTEEAKSSSGGNAGQGGDLLWRWGNPQAFGRGTTEDQQLFFQHDALWALDYLSEDQTDFGNISIFNNIKEEAHSYVGMIAPSFDTLSQRYLLSSDSIFLPQDFYYEWSHPEADVIYSTGLSSVQVLPNNNKLICSGRNGITVELSPEEEIVWMYKTPFRNGFRVEQGSDIVNNDNLTFRMRRYSPQYTAFDNKDLEPIEYLELNPDESWCNRLLDTNDLTVSPFTITQYGNEYLLIDNPLNQNYPVVLFDILGNHIYKDVFRTGQTKLDISQLETGIYILTFQDFKAYRFIKLN